MPIPIDVIEAGPHEAELFCALMHAAFDQYGAAGKPSGAMLETPDSVRAELATGVRIAIAWVDGDPAGQVKFELTDSGQFYFSRLGVMPDRRGDGVASALIGWLVELARAEGHAGLSCCIRAEETGLRAMYEHFGMHLTHGADKPSLTGRVTAVSYLAT